MHTMLERVSSSPDARRPGALSTAATDRRMPGNMEIPGMHVCPAKVLKKRGMRVRDNAAGAVRRTCYSDRAGSIVRKCARVRGWCGHMRLIRREFSRE